MVYTDVTSFTVTVENRKCGRFTCHCSGGNLVQYPRSL